MRTLILLFCLFAPPNYQKGVEQWRAVIADFAQPLMDAQRDGASQSELGRMAAKLRPALDRKAKNIPYELTIYCEPIASGEGPALIRPRATKFAMKMGNTGFYVPRSDGLAGAKRVKLRGSISVRDSSQPPTNALEYVPMELFDSPRVTDSRDEIRMIMFRFLVTSAEPVTD